jgi:hypothetical protein
LVAKGSTDGLSFVHDGLVFPRACILATWFGRAVLGARLLETVKTAVAGEGWRAV